MVTAHTVDAGGGRAGMVEGLDEEGAAAARRVEHAHCLELLQPGAPEVRQGAALRAVHGVDVVDPRVVERLNGRRLVLLLSKTAPQGLEAAREHRRQGALDDEAGDDPRRVEGALPLATRRLAHLEDAGGQLALDLLELGDRLLEDVTQDLAESARPPKGRSRGSRGPFPSTATTTRSSPMPKWPSPASAYSPRTSTLLSRERVWRSSAELGPVYPSTP
ncbi:MAG TPA: hypothetical protein VMT16_10160 [Thermoanaerobaculia bacterium]|nr:hypothetical protein [Thermoanaerobaculia bacterium]